VPTLTRTTVYVATKDDTQVFASANAIPAQLRHRLLISTRGMNSATILIADRGGREEIRKILSGEPSPLRGRLRGDYFRALAEKQTPSQEAAVVKPPAVTSERESSAKWRWLTELALPGAVGIGLWLLFTLR
jgi:hypothetical protein